MCCSCCCCNCSCCCCSCCSCCCCCGGRDFCCCDCCCCCSCSCCCCNCCCCCSTEEAIREAMIPGGSGVRNPSSPGPAIAIRFPCNAMPSCMACCGGGHCCKSFCCGGARGDDGGPPRWSFFIWRCSKSRSCCLASTCSPPPMTISSGRTPGALGGVPALGEDGTRGVATGLAYGSAEPPKGSGAWDADGD